MSQYVNFIERNLMFLWNFFGITLEAYADNEIKIWILTKKKKTCYELHMLCMNR